MVSVRPAVLVAMAALYQACSLTIPSDAELSAGLHKGDGGREGGKDGSTAESGGDGMSCGALDTKCSQGSECCSGLCNGSKCVSCLKEGETCVSGGCCGMTTCSAGQCVPCAAAGGDCSSTPCCTGRCNPGHQTCH